jgi:thioredoxin 1
METFGDVIQADQAVLVDFYADWCDPCKAMEPAISEIARSIAGVARIIKVNIDKNAKAAQAYNVTAVPTLMIFRKGKILWRHPGMIDKSKLLLVLAQYT